MAPPSQRSCGPGGHRTPSRGRRGKQNDRKKREVAFFRWAREHRGSLRQDPRATARRRRTARPALPAARRARGKRARAAAGWRGEWAGASGARAGCSGAVPTGQRVAGRGFGPQLPAAARALPWLAPGAEGAGRARPARSGSHRPRESGDLNGSPGELRLEEDRPGIVSRIPYALHQSRVRIKQIEPSAWVAQGCSERLTDSFKLLTL